MKKVSLKKNRH